ncbi:MAG: recombinase family protein [Thermodesulfobacteriota bacterium]|nr:recombinase family protein [Thermodesulfobacteriota bacterium]
MTFLQKIRQWIKKRNRKGGQQLIVRLDKASCERFLRLKTKISNSDENKLIALALKCLEQKTDKVIKRQIMKSIRQLTNEGLHPYQIASYMNQRGIPALGESDKWDGETISRLLETENRGFGMQ